ncbi:MAG: hypothetical protein ACP5GI_07460 [Sulfolobales archaeon]
MARALATTKILLPILFIALIGISFAYLNAQKTTTTPTNTQANTNTDQTATTTPANTATVTVTVTKTKTVTKECECECGKEEKKGRNHEEYGEHKQKGVFENPPLKVLNETEINGGVVSKSNRTLILVLDTGVKNYTVVLGPVYVRESDGVLVSGAYLFKNINVGDTLTIKTALIGNKSIVPALSVSLGNQVYSLPIYYKYEVLKS